eukprot:CAMPEP_0119304832 /NCGR_PEP_ID=MMETSP1333-20130426/5954_1 /TAXON_ID=418940 /ORGANISM="Scyphosphaera apsteinii, Strain RCC1455" /LENGTH=226 /DNA_ID=CAMNT_0007307779 /DNA_START=169 /DNA_END=849 /DNA_ORIENTATION=+
MGCPQHKKDGWVCQCNFHCEAHGDCCADFAAACPNTTDPMLGNHTHEEKTGNHTHANQAAKHAVKADRTSEHPTAAVHEKHPAHKPPPSKTTAKPDRTSDHPKANIPHKSGSSTQDHHHDEKEEHEKKEREEHAKKEREDKERHSHEHAHGGINRGNMLVIFGMVVSLTVPITISLILVLRSRGMCGGKDFEPVHASETAASENNGIALNAVPAAGPGSPMNVLAT